MAIKVAGQPRFDLTHRNPVTRIPVPAADPGSALPEANPVLE